MRWIPLLLLVVLVTAGCAARLPVPNTAPVARVAPAPVPGPVTATDFARAVDGLGGPDVSILRCGLEPEAGHGEVTHAAHGGHGGHEEHKQHEIALFLGYTFERGDGGFTVGVDYGYWITERVGIGPFLDFVAGDINAIALGAGVWFRPVCRLPDLTLYVAPGLDISHEVEDHGHGHVEKTWETTPLLRFGVLYGIDLGCDYRLMPSFYWDLIFPDKQAYVIGLTLGKEF